MDLISAERYKDEEAEFLKIWKKKKLMKFG